MVLYLQSMKQLYLWSQFSFKVLLFLCRNASKTFFLFSTMPAAQNLFTGFCSVLHSTWNLAMVEATRSRWSLGYVEQIQKCYSWAITFPKFCGTPHQTCWRLWLTAFLALCQGAGHVSRHIWCQVMQNLAKLIVFTKVITWEYPLSIYMRP